MNRPSWDDYFMNIAALTSHRSNCIKRKVGCIIVKDKRILSLGYNGTPTNIKNCYEGGCDRCNEITISGHSLDLCICIHAEQNALLFNSKNELSDSVLYTTLHPCIACCKLIIQCGISKIHYIEDYNHEITRDAQKLLKSANIDCIKLNQPH